MGVLLSNKIKYLFFALGAILVGLNTSAQVNITPTQTAAILAQKLAGPGVIISNPTLTCAPQGNGIFKVVTSNLGLDSGIILTTGKAAAASGPQSTLVSNNMGQPGDASLVPLANTTTNDACSLEFDVQAKGDSISFNYVFGSEEYTNSVCGPYNDAFAFFISGPGITGTENMALVPGTTIPVTVNSVNNGVPGPYANGSLANCQIYGGGSPFTSYYNNNTTGTTIAYYGLTKVLAAKHDVTPCATYHLKLAIADGNNFLYDSGVFLAAGSLTTTTVHVDSIGGHTYGGVTNSIVKGCSPGGFRVKSSQPKPTIQTVKFLLAGTAVSGVDYAPLTDSVNIPANDTQAFVPVTALPTAANGTKTLIVYVLSNYSCNGSNIVDTTVLNLIDPPSVNVLSNDTTVCLGANVPLSATGNPLATFSWSPAAGINNTGGLSPVATPGATTTYTIAAGMKDSGCPPVEDTVRISVIDPPVVDAGADQLLCTNAPLLLNVGATPPNPDYVYQWTGPHGFIAYTTDPSISNVLPTDSGYYKISVSVKYCTPSFDSVHIAISPQPVIDLGPDQEICEDATLALNVNEETKGLPYDYQWSGPNAFSATAKSPAIPNVSLDAAGTYTVAVSLDNCPPTTGSMNVTVYPTPAPPIVVSPITYCQGHEADNLTALGNNLLWYADEYATKGLPAAPVPYTNLLGAHRYSVTQVSNGCESPKSNIDVITENCCEASIFAPDAFTPNGDGHNDRYHIITGVENKLLNLEIYNRWGQMVYHTKGDDSWDGTANGQPLDMGGYFYMLTIECGNGTIINRKGDITLIR